MPVLSELSRRAFGGVLSVLLASCAVGPNFVRPTAPTVEGYLPAGSGSATANADDTAQRFIAGEPVAADWWKLFHVADLDATVSEALKRNQTLAAASSSLRQSEDALRAGNGVFFPNVSADAGASRQLYSPLKIGEKAPGSIFNLFTVSGTVGYLVDVFGGARRQTEALRAQVDVERNAAVAAYLTLTANVVNTSIARAAYRAEVAATRAGVEAASEQLKLTEVQAAAGTIPYAVVLGQRSQLAALQASLAPLELRADQADHLLAVLVGRSPAEWSPPDIALADFALPTDLPVSVPSALVRQRPDVLEAEGELHVASAQIGVATAALFPTLTLNGSLGNNALTWNSLGQKAGNGWSSGADLSVPVFQGGTTWYTRKAAIDAYHAALADYHQTVLTAFQQVADSLRALDHDAESVSATDSAARAARTLLDLSRANYQAGLSDYLAVLTATSNYETAQLAYLAAAGQRLQDTVALFVALGGGWWNAPQPVPGVAPVTTPPGR
jgi:NodT family efflux transporter outer membrane factor (OMF) lipoprotein